MANRVIDVALRLTDNFSGGFGQAMRNMIDGSKRGMHAAKSIIDTGNTIAGMGTKMTATITTPIIGIGTAAASTAINFDSAMSRVQAISGATGNEFKQLRDQAMELGASSVFSAREAAQGMENLASAGFSVAEISEAMPGLLNLAASSGESLAVSADIAASTVRGFGLEANATAHVADVLAKNAANTNAAVYDTGEALKYIAPSANAAGLAMEEMVAAIGIMANNGIKGSQAGTTLRGAITRLEKPTKQMNEAMEAIGFTAYDSEGRMKSLADMIKQLQVGTAGLTDQEKQLRLAQIFGTESLSGMMALINSAPGTLDELTNAYVTTEGAATEMAETMLNNTGGAINELKGAVETASIAIGDVLTPYIKQAAEFVKNLVEKFNALSPAQKEQIVRWGAIAAAAGPAIMILGKSISVFGGMMRDINKLSYSIAKLDAFKKIAPVWKAFLALGKGPMIGVVGGVAVAILAIVTNLDRLKAGISASMPFITKIKTQMKDLKVQWDPVITVIKQTGIFLNEVFGTALTGLISGAIGVFGSLLSGVAGVLQNVKGILGGLIDFIAGGFTGDWDRAWNGVKSIFTGIFDSLVEVAKTTINAVSGVINGVIGAINGAGFTIPDWVPVVGGKEFSLNIPMLPVLAKGTDNWQGGFAQVHEKGGEIIDLPRGSRVYPHDKSIAMARLEGRSEGYKIVISGNTFNVRDEGDIERVAVELLKKLKMSASMMGGVSIADMA